MKKKIIGILIAVAMLGVVAFQVAPVLADAGPLDRVTITPSPVSLLPGGTQQFTAQGYDSSNIAISGLKYFWLASAGGAISDKGLFTAPATPNFYPNAVQVVAIKGGIAKGAYASVTVVAAAGPLDHVVITPASATIAVGATKQFAAQGYDASNLAIAGLTYSWSTTGGGTIIPATGVFTAPIIGTYPIQVSTTQGLITKTATASVTVTAAPPSQDEEQSPVKPNIKKLTGLFSSFLKGIGFDNFYGGQWTIKENGVVNTYKVIPGVVKSVSTIAPNILLAVLPNGQATNVNFTFPTGTSILPKGTTLAINDKVVVVTVNDQVKLVYKIATVTATTGTTPPGLQKNGKERDEDKGTPHGWQMGKKVGWSKGNQTDTEED